jgi:hypothetical protein
MTDVLMTVKIWKQLRLYLDAMAETGLFGATAEEVARELVREGVLRALSDRSGLRGAILGALERLEAEAGEPQKVDVHYVDEGGTRHPVMRGSTKKITQVNPALDKDGQIHFHPSDNAGENGKETQPEPNSESAPPAEPDEAQETAGAPGEEAAAQVYETGWDDPGKVETPEPDEGHGEPDPATSSAPSDPSADECGKSDTARPKGATIDHDGRELEVWKAIAGFISDKGVTPRNVDIARLSGVPAGSMARYLVSLHEKGRIKRVYTEDSQIFHVLEWPEGIAPREGAPRPVPRSTAGRAKGFKHFDAGDERRKESVAPAPPPAPKEPADDQLRPLDITAPGVCHEPGCRNPRQPGKLICASCNNKRLAPNPRANMIDSGGGGNWP